MAGLYADDDLPEIANALGRLGRPARPRRAVRARALVEARDRAGARPRGFGRLELSVTDARVRRRRALRALGFRRTGVTIPLGSAAA